MILPRMVNQLKRIEFSLSFVEESQRYLISNSLEINQDFLNNKQISAFIIKMSKLDAIHSKTRSTRIYFLFNKHSLSDFSHLLKICGVNCRYGSCSWKVITSALNYFNNGRVSGVESTICFHLQIS